MKPTPTKAEVVKAIREAAQVAWEKHWEEHPLEANGYDDEDRPSEYGLRSEALSHAVRISEPSDSTGMVLHKAQHFFEWLKDGLKDPAVPAEPESEDAP